MSVDEVSIEAFGHLFKNILPEFAENLRALETEGAIYADFADYDSSGKHIGTFSRYRIKFTPAEIFEFVEAHLAHQEFAEALTLTGDFTAAVLAISKEKYRRRVTEYSNYGNGRLATGKIVDIRGCFASFVGPDMEALICGAIPERYEAVPELGGTANQNELALNALKSIPVAVRRLRERANGRTAFAVENEYDVQDLTETVLRGIFSDVVREEWTPKVAGGAKRIDLVVRSVGIVVECKYVRDRKHARSIADELRIDFESYHEYRPCRQLYVYIHDPGAFIADPEAFCRDLNGIRKKKDHEFSVLVLIGS
ncbi:hypothetical protein B0I31_103559 [Saccharothrix carnea]|uniref:Uncharacterized protein n=1 Tax=Saccharothrix carnea TaxID=1280637 RepID=A0A2P8IEC3_SACCR|nr:hypothetical protein [Saccharothrix carnea]PSL56802.1 hypothetical protein B0I31_103559 [Saccharothrix carnea]